MPAINRAVATVARKRKPGKPKPKAEKRFENRPLSNLKQALEAPPPAHEAAPDLPDPPEAENTPLPTPDPNDDQLFFDAMAGVLPMADHSTHLPPEPKLPERPDARLLEDQEVLATLQDLVTGDRPFSIHETDEAIEGLAEGCDSRLLRKLKRGEYSVQDHLDLHGFSREEARPEVTRFLLGAIAHSKRCVLIIHGRGHGSKDKIPVLKLALRTWLERSAIRKSILAFCTARPCDGGAGAIYVLLRKSKGSA